jgi:hypothetical protein
MGRSKHVPMTKELEDLICNAYHNLRVSTSNIAKKKKIRVEEVVRVLEKRGIAIRGVRGRSPRW